MSSTQPQLLQQPLNPADIIYTPDWVAKDMVSFFKPFGRILEPAKGDGVFLKYLPPGTEWCEIAEGKDFFAWHEKVDWIISNPPFSHSILTNWLQHSFRLADHVVYLLPLHWIFRAKGRIEQIKKYGWIRQIRIYGTGGKLGFSFGNPVAAFYFMRGCEHVTTWSWY